MFLEGWKIRAVHVFGHKTPDMPIYEGKSTVRRVYYFDLSNDRQALAKRAKATFNAVREVRKTMP